jgi:hypothetical protein
MPTASAYIDEMNTQLGPNWMLHLTENPTSSAFETHARNYPGENSTVFATYNGLLCSALFNKCGGLCGKNRCFKDAIGGTISFIKNSMPKALFDQLVANSIVSDAEREKLISSEKNIVEKRLNGDGCGTPKYTTVQLDAVNELHRVQQASIAEAVADAAAAAIATAEAAAAAIATAEAAAYATATAAAAGPATYAAIVAASDTTAAATAMAALAAMK